MAGSERGAYAQSRIFALAKRGKDAICDEALHEAPSTQ